MTIHVERIPAQSELDAEPAFAYDVAIVGLGYVGLPTALAYHQAGSRVLALDISVRRLAGIRSGAVDLLESDHARLAAALTSPEFTLSDDPADLGRAAAVVVCVPTPVDRHLIPDLSLLKAACAMAVACATPGQLLMLTSTSYVGSTHDLLQVPLEERGLRVGRDVFVAFSAERIDPGNASFGHDQVPRVLGGATQECEEEGFRLLSRCTDRVHVVPSLGAAEMTKLLENTFRAVNIALANEFADICRSLDLDVTDVIDAAATKPYGFTPFYPGPGVGGHCIPCDPHYLLWQLRETRISAPLISRAMEQIAERPARVVSRAREVLSDAGRGVLGSRILVVGIAYKPNVADLRESPALEILDGLAALGSEVGFLDAHFARVQLPSGMWLDAVIDPADFGADLVLLHTTHDEVDLDWIDSDHLVLDATYRARVLPNTIAL